MEFLRQATWSPYLVGFAIGVLSWLSFLISRKALGTSTSYARTSGMIWQKYDRDLVLNMKYYQQYLPEIDWQWMLVLGIILGSFISALLSGEFSITFLPATDFESVLNQNFLGRIFSALAGGMLVGFGARWSGGCTSGHGISGTLQLSLSSWIAAICFFIGGIAAALLLY